MMHHDHFSNPRTMSTEDRIYQYEGKNALLQTWERQPYDHQDREYEYIKDLRRRVAQVRNYILHRADPLADPLMPKRHDPNH